MTGGRSSRAITDAPSLTALAHPTRLALMEAIAVAGTLTATQASPLVGESPTACAYHLRTLARLGFIEEADGGPGRQRPWRLAQSSMSVDEDSDNPAAAAAARALSTAAIEHWIARIRAFQLARPRLPEEVRGVTGANEALVFATPAELAQLLTDMWELISRYTDRMDPARRPPGSQPFELVLFTHILDVFGQGDSDAQAAADS